MNKVVYHRGYGGFCLSEKMQDWMREHGHPEYAVFDPEIERHNPLLVQCVEEAGEGYYCERGIVEIPGNKYWIEEYDGAEKVHTPEWMEWVVIDPIQEIEPDGGAELDERE